jgi:hypothetical protein
MSTQKKQDEKAFWKKLHCLLQQRTFARSQSNPHCPRNHSIDSLPLILELYELILLRFSIKAKNEIIGDLLEEYRGVFNQRKQIAATRWLYKQIGLSLLHLFVQRLKIIAMVTWRKHSNDFLQSTTQFLAHNRISMQLLHRNSLLSTLMVCITVICVVTIVLRLRQEHINPQEAKQENNYPPKIYPGYQYTLPEQSPVIPDKESQSTIPPAPEPRIGKVPKSEPKTSEGKRYNNQAEQLSYLAIVLDGYKLAGPRNDPKSDEPDFNAEKQEYIKLPAAQLHLSLRLPDGRPGERYTVSLQDAYTQNITSVKALCRKGKILKVVLDTRVLSTPAKFLSILGSDQERSPLLYRVTIDNQMLGQKLSLPGKQGTQSLCADMVLNAKENVKGKRGKQK